MSVTGPQLENVLQQLQATAAQASVPPQPSSHGTADSGSFANALVSAINKIDAIQDAAGAQAKAFERGDPTVSLSNVMIDLQKAGLAFEMGIQVRNRLVSAYKDIMNMRV